MKAPQWVRLVVLAFAVMSAVGVIALVACGSAAPSSQSGGGGGSGEKENPTETPTLTPTLHPDCVTLTLPDGGTGVSCPPPGPDNVEGNLRRHYNRVMATQEAQAERRSVVEPVYIDVLVDTDSIAAMHSVAEFLESHEDAGKINLYPEPGRYGAAGMVAKHVNMELIPEIAAIEGVVRVEKESVGVPLSSQGQPAPNPAVLARMGVDDWHAAGVTGSGVGVAVIDSGFKDFRTRVMPSLSEPAKFLCYDSDNNLHEGYVPTLTPAPGSIPVVVLGPTPTPKFVACEEGTDDHGTGTVESLLEIAPDVKLYISDANTPERRVEAVNWLTSGRSDNAIAATRVYDVMANDEYNVKVINHSIGEVWDGPGDGTSDLVSVKRRSLLNIVKDSVDGGAMWVNAAGNRALQTWYSTFVPFNRPVGGIRYLDFSSVRYSHTGGNNPCNRVTLVDGEDYVFQTRWDGDWEGGDVDLELHLLREAGTNNQGDVVPRLMISTMGVQAGPGTAPPFEKLEWSTGVGLGGDYCVLITRDSGERELRWLQFQIFSGAGDVDFHTKVGSIVNPAESPSDGMLAVGAGKFKLVLPGTLPPVPAPLPTAVVELHAFSARGPVPGIPLHLKPEVVGINTDVLGTSDAAPQVSGLAALVAQTFGSSIRPSYLAYILSANRGAANLAQLPSLEAPTNVRVSQGLCARRQLEVQFDHPSINLVPVLFDARAVQSGVGGVSGAVFEGSVGFGNTGYVGIGTDRGAYDVTVRACARGEFCGPWSSPPTRFTTTSMVCKPDWFQAVPGDGKATLWWNPDPDATGYTVDSVQDSVSGEEHVIDGLTNGTSYSYRVQVLGPGGPSDWRGDSVRPQVSLNRPPKPTKLIVEENNSRRFPGVALKWEAPFGSYLYEIRVSGGGVVSLVVDVASWERLPFQPIGWDSEYSARFFGSYGRVGDKTDRVTNVGEAIVAGLIPGTEYHFAVRAARERNSSEQLNYSPWSEPVMLKTLGVRPASAPGQVSAPVLKAPPEGLVAVVNGTTVNLSWTAATNPNYVRQVVFRREAGVSPMQWTEIPVGLNDTTYTDTGLTSGITYRYRVRSYKQLVDGNYGESGHAEAVIP